MENSHTFLYFAYGSNLLKERLRLQNPSAMVHCVARLKVTSASAWGQRCFAHDSFSRVTGIFNFLGLQTGVWELQRPGQ